MRPEDMTPEDIRQELLRLSMELKKTFKGIVGNKSGLGLSGLIEQENKHNKQLTRRDRYAKLLNRALLPIVDDMQKYLSDKTIQGSVPYAEFCARCISLDYESFNIPMAVKRIAALNPN